MRHRDPNARNCHSFTEPWHFFLRRDLTSGYCHPSLQFNFHVRLPKVNALQLDFNLTCGMQALWRIFSAKSWAFDRFRDLGCHLSDRDMMQRLTAFPADLSLPSRKNQRERERERKSSNVKANFEECWFDIGRFSVSPFFRCAARRGYI